MSHACVGMRGSFPLVSGMPTQAWDMAPEYYQQELITLVEDLRSQGVGFRSINEGAIDTTCASGALIFNIFSALAQFERRLIQERTKAGLAAARARGRNGRRPKITADDTKVVLAKKLHADKSLEIDDICKTLRMSRSTFYRYVRL